MNYELYQDSKDEEIINLFIKTFSDSEGEEEGKLIGKLVSDLLSDTPIEEIYIYTASENAIITGCIFFSKLKFDHKNINAFILSPVAVHTDFQKQGIGQKLINFGHSDLKKKKVELVITYGDINFYSKTGYKPITEDVIKAPLKLSYPEGWIAQNLNGNDIPVIPGKSHCVSALNNPAYW